MPLYEKTGYLKQEYQIFHLNSQEEKEYAFHFHDFHKVLLLISGDVTYSIEGKSYQLKPYDLVMVNKGEMHRPIVHSTNPYERIILYISTDFLSDQSSKDYVLNSCFEKSYAEQSHVLHLAALKDNTLIPLLNSLVKTLSDTDFGNRLHQQILFLEFIIQLNRTVLHAPNVFSDTAVGNDKIISVLSYINTHLTEDISIDSLAERFYISRYHLMHSFKLETGYTIGQYLTTKRLLYAQELIKNDMPVTEACLTCGFQNYSTFSRAYKKNFGTSPSRQKNIYYPTTASPAEIE